MKKTTTALATAAVMMLVATPAIAQGRSGLGSDTNRDLATASAATAGYHDVTAARGDGFTPFAIPEEVGGTLLEIDGEEITCFDGASGGMGVHYVRNIDDVLDPADPEALVYAVTDHGLQLVALEYIIPEGFVDPASPPVLFGETMHHHSYLPVYVLHVWVWATNPSGLFADFNPRVGACPS